MTEILINDLRPRTQITQPDDPGELTQYDFGFPILAKTDLKVAIDDAIVDAGDYTVTGEGTATGGYVQFTGVQPPAGSRITMWRDMAFERTTDFAPGADLRASVLNDELDRTALLLQQAEALVGDSLHRRPYDVDKELILPTVTERAGKYLSFDADGMPEAVNVRLLGDIANLALIYSGPSATEPTMRLDGTPLQNGDLYFNTSTATLMHRAGGVWTVAYVDTAGVLPLSGASPMTGDLDMGGNAITSVGTVDGIDVSALSNSVDGLVANGSADDDARALAIHNAWEIARIDGLSAYTMANTYQDVFTDETGVDGDTTAQDVLSGLSATSNIALFNGSFGAFTDGNTTSYAQFSGANNSGVHINYDLGDGNAAALTRLRSFHFSNQASPSVFSVRASDTSTFGGEEVEIALGQTLDSLADDDWGEIAWGNSTAYRYWRFTVDAVKNTANSQRPLVTELQAFPADIPGDSANVTYNQSSDHFESNAGDALTISSFTGGASAVTATTITMTTSNQGGYADVGSKLIGDFDISFTVDSHFNTIERIGVIRESALGNLNTGTYGGATVTGVLAFSLNTLSRGIEKNSSTTALAALSPATGTVYRMVRSGADVALYEGATLRHTETGWGADDMRICFSHHSDSVAWTVDYTILSNITNGAMSLVSNLITAEAAPAEARGLVDVEVLDASVANTDFHLRISRDDGVTWNDFTLAKISAPTTTRAVYAASVSWDPVGVDTDIRLKFDTSASAKVRVHRWALQADQPLSF